MICEKCGYRVPDGVSSCPSCGAKMPRVSDSVCVPDGRNHDKYKRMGGFLSTIVIICIIEVVALYLYLVYEIVSGITFFERLTYLRVWISREMYIFVICDLIVGWLLIGLDGAMTIVYLIKLIRRKYSFLRFRQYTYLIKLVITALYYVGSMRFMYLSGYFKKGWITIGAIVIICSVLIRFFIEKVYFKRSVRVRCYMGSDRYVKVSLFNKEKPSNC